MNSSKSVAIILPTYNEGKSIFETLSEIDNSLASLNNYVFKIFVAEDGSSDNTKICLKIKNTNGTCWGIGTSWI